MKNSIIFTSIIFLFSTISLVSASEAEQMACTMEYAPVCAKVEVQCFRAPCYPVYKTFSNKCMMNSEKATEVHNDACSEFEEGSPVVISETLKTFLTTYFNNFLQKISILDNTSKLSRLERIDTKISNRLNSLVSNISLELDEEIKNDKIKYSLIFLQDLTKKNIWNTQEIISGKRYLFRDTVKCEGVKFKCSDWETAFFDEVGCWCKK